MTEILTDYDPAIALETPEAIADFMADAFESGDAGYIAYAMGIVARSKGMTKLSAETGLAREAMYKSFAANGNPTLKSTLSMLKAFGLELTTKPHR